jgi:hypothetical protein
MSKLLLLAGLVISTVLSWEYNPTEKLLSFSLEKQDSLTEEDLAGLPSLGAWS